MNRKAVWAGVAAVAFVGLGYYLLSGPGPPVPESDPFPTGGGGPGFALTRVEFRTPAGPRAAKPERHGWSLPWNVRGAVVLTGTADAGADAVRGRLSQIDTSRLTETPMGEVAVTPTGPTAFRIEIAADQLAPAAVYRLVLDRGAAGASTAYHFNTSNAPRPR